MTLLYPLDEFYARSGLPLPTVVPVEPQQVPAPYRALLVHTRDMTPTLAAAYGCTMELRVMERHVLPSSAYSRRIVLAAAGKPVLFGAIKIYLHRFSYHARELILSGAMPFGTVLQTCGVVHSSCPIAFFQIAADDVIRDALGFTGSTPLHGRRNVHRDAEGQVLAQVFEVLAPFRA